MADASENNATPKREPITVRAISGRGAEALQRFNPLRWFQRESVESLVERGALLADRGSYLSAQRAFQEALSRDKSSLAALRGLGTALMMQGSRANLAAAQAHLQEVVRREPADLPVYVALANIYDKLGRSADADRERRKAALIKRLQQEPNNSAANNNLGILLVQQRHWESAMACFRKALEADPKLDVAWRNLAATCYRLAAADPRESERGRLAAEGLEAVEKAMAFGLNLTNLLTKALLKSVGGDTQGAVDVSAEAQVQAPQNPEVYAVMRTVLERAGMFNEALRANEIHEDLVRGDFAAASQVAPPISALRPGPSKAPPAPDAKAGQLPAVQD